MPRYPEPCDVSVSNLRRGFAVDPGSREDLEPCCQRTKEALILVTSGYAGSQRRRTWECDSAQTELRSVDLEGHRSRGHLCRQPPSGTMTTKRKRRTAAQQNGLAPGETLNRAQLPGREELYWGWISSVPNATSISDDHLLRTCGFSPHSQPRFCSNRYARSSAASLEPSPVTDLDGDLIVVSDDEGPVCDKKSCQSNPYCLNHLGQKRWEDEGMLLGTRAVARV